MGGEWNVSAGTSLKKYFQFVLNGPRTSQCNFMNFLQNHFPGASDLTISFSTNASYTHQKHLLLRDLQVYLQVQHRNQHQKFQGLWLGRDLANNENIIALPLDYGLYTSTATGVNKCRQITPLPREEQHKLKILKSQNHPLALPQRRPHPQE